MPILPELRTSQAVDSSDDDVGAVRLAQEPKANSAAAADSLSAFAEQGGTMSGVPPNCVELKLIGTSESNYPRCLRGG